MCLSELQSKLSGQLMISLAWNVGKFRVERETILGLHGWPGGFFSCGFSSQDWCYGVFFYVNSSWPRETPQAVPFMPPLYHSAMALPCTEKFELLLCLMLSPPWEWVGC